MGASITLALNFDDWQPWAGLPEPKIATGPFGKGLPVDSLLTFLRVKSIKFIDRVEMEIFKTEL